jgi:hypothetical protein
MTRGILGTFLNAFQDSVPEVEALRKPSDKSPGTGSQDGDGRHERQHEARGHICVDHDPKLPTCIENMSSSIDALCCQRVFIDADGFNDVHR